MIEEHPQKWLQVLCGFRFGSGSGVRIGFQFRSGQGHGQGQGQGQGYGGVVPPWIAREHVAPLLPTGRSWRWGQARACAS